MRLLNAHSLNLGMLGNLHTSLQILSLPASLLCSGPLGGYSLHEASTGLFCSLASGWIGPKGDTGTRLEVGERYSSIYFLDSPCWAPRLPDSVPLQQTTGPGRLPPVQLQPWVPVSLSSPVSLGEWKLEHPTVDRPGCFTMPCWLPFTLFTPL